MDGPVGDPTDVHTVVKRNARMDSRGVDQERQPVGGWLGTGKKLPIKNVSPWEVSFLGRFGTVSADPHLPNGHFCITDHSLMIPEKCERLLDFSVSGRGGLPAPA